MLKGYRKLLVPLGTAMCLALGLQGTVLADGERISRGVSIDGMDVSDLTYEQAEASVETQVSRMLTADFKVQVGEDSIDADAVDFGLQWKNRDVVKQALGLGNTGNLIKRYKEAKDLTQQEVDLKLEFTASEAAVRDFVENKCKQFEKQAQDASIEADGAGGVNVQPGVTGQVIDVDASVKAIQDYIASDWGGGDGSVTLTVAMSEPKGKTKDLEQIQDVLGTYTTYYSGTYGRNINVERGAELINGHILWPGDEFSVCDHLVPFSAENGYELGGEYAAGRVVQGYGGGICQVSTTLYNALLLAEVEIIERHCHTMSVSYVPTSMDAAIAEGAFDLVFRNNRETPIFISGYAYGGELTFTVWGKETRPDDRYIYYESETISTIPAPAGVSMVANPDQNMGYISQVMAAAPGSSAVLYKYITQNGETTYEVVNESTYEATAATYEVGTAGATDSLLTALYSGDLASVQLAATGAVTINPDGTPANGQQPQTDANGVTINPDGSYTDPTTGATVNAGGYMDTPDGEVFIGDGFTYYDGGDGTITW